MQTDGSESRARSLARFFADLHLEEVPAPVVERVRLLLLDSIGLAIAAASRPWSRLAIDTVKEMRGTRESAVLGTNLRLPAPNAALANGTLIHALDFDDTHLDTGLHPSSFVMASALAAAQACAADGKSTLAAALAGYETAIRIATASRNALFERGFHMSGVFGPMGAAAAASRARSLDTDQMASAIGISASFCSGILQAQLEGAPVKAIHPGWAAHAGVMAANLAAKGMKGPDHVFEGKLGFFNSYVGSGHYDLEPIAADLGSKWHVMDVSLKMYPAGHRSHFFIDSALRIAREHKLAAEDVDSVVCVVPAYLVYLHFQPVAYKPPNGYTARFSLPFIIATCLSKGEVVLDSFEDACVSDASLLELASRVTYRIEENADLPQNRGHIVLRTKDGRAMETRSLHILGTPENPATKSDVEVKFSKAVRGLLPQAQELALLDKLARIEELTDIGQLMELTQSAPNSRRRAWNAPA